MEFDLLGWSTDEPTLELDWRSFSYAGKFATARTGKAVAREDGEIIGALSFDPDRTDSGTLRFRYVTVRADRRGEGVGSRLLAFGLTRAADRGYERVRIAVNNPFAYQACYRAGFGYTGATTGLAELLLEWPPSGSADRYRAGLDRFRGRDLSDEELEFLERTASTEPPEPLVASD